MMLAIGLISPISVTLLDVVTRRIVSILLFAVSVRLTSVRGGGWKFGRMTMCLIPWVLFLIAIRLSFDCYDIARVVASIYLGVISILRFLFGTLISVGNLEVLIWHLVLVMLLWTMMVVVDGDIVTRNGKS